MILFKDNFLENDLFNILSIRIENLVNKDSLKKTGSWIKHSNYISGDLDCIKSDYGIFFSTSVSKIQKELEDSLKSRVLPYSLRFQSITPYHEIHKHLDGPVRNKNLSESFSTILYVHRSWDINNGMEFFTDSIDIAPIPNRLIIYDRSIAHGVRKSNTKLNIERTLMLVSWSIL